MEAIARKRDVSSNTPSAEDDGRSYLDLGRFWQKTANVGVSRPRPTYGKKGRVRKPHLF